LAGVAVAHHNTIQFVGYEVANVTLIIQQYLADRSSGFGLTLESAAALAFLSGSVLIMRFNPICRPGNLFTGGMALAFGGLLLVASGYPLTGLAVALASLETARGGVFTLVGHVEARQAEHRPVTRSTRRLLRTGSRILGGYIRCVNRVLLRRQHLGQFVNERPFLTGTLMKAPLRIEFVVKKVLSGDVVGAAVGLSWMILGDGGLALNDERLKASLNRFATSEGSP